ncbi:hypothetical protein [Streptomyces sp. NPDC002133]|uniref:hypothetical protein n=1 Tax=Streptomyces sp. NPDC002133 TaxID=3154409 RepID=UPI00331A351A
MSEASVAQTFSHEGGRTEHAHIRILQDRPPALCRGRCRSGVLLHDVHRAGYRRGRRAVTTGAGHAPFAASKPQGGVTTGGGAMADIAS